MKKIACLLLAAILVIAVGTALADGISVSASYDNGTLSVSTTASGYFTISVDGVGTRRSLTPSVPSLSFNYPLEDGVHTITIANDVLGSASTSVRVGAAPTEAPTVEPTVEPTAAPTEEPTVEPTAAPTEVPVGPIKIVGTPSYQNGVLTFTVSGLTGYAGECWVDGSATGKSVNNGENTVNVRLDAGKHTLTVVYLDEQDSRTFDVTFTNPAITASYTKAGVVDFTVSNLNTRSEIWLDGKATGVSVTVDGSYTLAATLECESTHTLMVYDPANNLSGTCSFTVNHIMKELEAVPATCTEAGKTAGKVCALCGKVFEAQQEVAALGHAIVIDPAVAPTCTEDGKTEGQHCSRCGLVLVAQTVVPATGHVVEVVPGVAPTCTATGLTDGEKCSVCGLVLKAQEVIPMIAHTVEIIPGVEPTCTKAGLSDGEKCSVCGTVLKEQEELKALGHNYVCIKRTEEEVVYRCSRCGDTFSQKNPVVVVKETKNIYGSIVKDAKMVDVDYTATADMLDQKCLVITADLNCKPDLTTELGLYLDEALIAQLIKEGYATVKFVNGDATIVITLAEIKPDWFSTTDTIWFYVFSTDPAAENGTLVKVEAQISGTEKIPADKFSGVIFKAAKEDVAVTENGIY